MTLIALPSSSAQALGSACFGLAGVLAFTSLHPACRAQASRLVAMALIVGLALFASHWTSSFAAIFILATGLTEVSFLQNLAAILRGNSQDYFKYLEALSHDQAAAKAAREQAALACPVPGLEASPPERAPETPDRILALKERALDRLEAELGLRIARRVRVRVGGQWLEADGACEEPGPLRVVQVLCLTDPGGEAGLPGLLAPLVAQMDRGAGAPGRSFKLHLVLALDGVPAPALEPLLRILAKARVGTALSVVDLTGGPA